jgi:hypothetical protein
MKKLRAVGMLVMFALTMSIRPALAQDQPPPEPTITPTPIDADLSVKAGRFLGLKLGMTLDQARAAGAQNLYNRPAAAFGPYVEAGSMPVEIPNTFYRSMYFTDQYGLYRVLYYIGAPVGRKLGEDAAFALVSGIAQKLAHDNPQVKVVRKIVPDPNQLSLEAIRECPAGGGAFKDNINSVSIDQIRALLVKAGAVPGVRLSRKSAMLAMYCGALPWAGFETAETSDGTVRVNFGLGMVDNDITKGMQVYIEFVNNTIKALEKR